MKRVLWIVFAALAVGVGVYPALYIVTDMSGALLSTKSLELLEQLAWNIAFYTHIVAGGIALLTGWSQFLTGRRSRYFKHHRVLGTIYVAACLLSGVVAFSLAFAAVTLRIYLPLAQAAGIPFAVSYPIISFLCWVPNLLVAELLLLRFRLRRAQFANAVPQLSGMVAD